jgi:3-methyladenine DNA glycosylase/8-oxoguanine DNA glycosylase
MRFAVDARFDLRATMRVHRHGAGDPCSRMATGEVWWATRTPEGPATLHLFHRGDTVTAQSWGEGSGWLLARVPDLLGQQDDVSAFSPEEPVVARAWHRHRGTRTSRSGIVLPPLLAATVTQRVTSGEAAAAWRSLCWRLGDPAPGPTPGPLRLPPDPERVAAQPAWWYHRLGVERRRADTLRRVARHAVRMQEAAAMPLPQAYARLRAIDGVGPWTAATTGGPVFGDPDAVVVGDFHLPHVVSWALAGEARATDERMLELLEPFAGHRGRVVRLLVADGHRAPAFGPRRRILPIARW